MIEIYEHLRAPGWRYNLTQEIIQRYKSESCIDDSYLSSIVQFFRQRGRKKSGRPKAVYILFEEALQIHLNGRKDSLRWMIEAGLLTEASDEQIADTLGLKGEVVEAYRIMFFDINRENKVALIHSVLSVSKARISDFLGDCDYSWKLFCSAAGYEGWCALLDFLTGVPFAPKFLEIMKSICRSKLVMKSFDMANSDNPNVSMLEKLDSINIRRAEIERTEHGNSDDVQEAAYAILRVCTESLNSTDNENLISENTAAFEPVLTTVEYYE